MTQEDELAQETVSSIETKIDKYNKKRKHLAQLKKTMAGEGKKQLTITDPESRAMKNNGKNRCGIQHAIRRR